MTSKFLMLALLGTASLSAAAQTAAVPNLAEIAARDYRERARFPAWSQPILNAVDPLMRDRLVSPVRLAGPNPGESITVWSDAIRYEEGDTAALFAQLEGLSADWTVRMQIDNAAGRVAEVLMQDDGQGADAVAADGIYAAQWTLPKAAQPAMGQADNLMLKVLATGADGAERRGLGGLLYSHPGAELTGRYRHQLQQGNLLLQAEVLVHTLGRYHLSGTLATLEGLPVAEAQQAQQLEPGQHWMDLPIYGLIFHELSLLSPLQLSSISLSTANGMPNALGPVHRQVLQLPALPLAELTDVAFGDASLLDAAERLEAGSKLRRLSQTLQGVLGN
ncbi:MAG: choice-of-anchor X domain-containing protein [Oceanococcaceae bacterium]